MLEPHTRESRASVDGSSNLKDLVALGLWMAGAAALQGQSKTVATDWGDEVSGFHSPSIRTFGSPSSDPTGIHLWGEAVHRNPDGEKLQIGCWAMELARRLVEAHDLPICILNGAVGGTRIDQHQRARGSDVLRGADWDARGQGAVRAGISSATSQSESVASQG